MRKMNSLRGLSAAALLLFGASVVSNEAAAQDVNCKGCVGATDIGKNAIKSKHIKNGAIKAKDLGKRAKPGSVAASSLANLLGGGIVIPGMATSVLRQVNIRLPGPGAVIATGTAILSVTGTMFCKVDSAATPVSATENFTAGNNSIESITAQRVIPVPAGTVTVYFICTNVTAGGGSVFNPNLSVLFVPDAQTIVAADAAPDAAAGQIPVGQLLK